MEDTIVSIAVRVGGGVGSHCGGGAYCGGRTGWQDVNGLLFQIITKIGR